MGSGSYVPLEHLVVFGALVHDAGEASASCAGGYSVWTSKAQTAAQLRKSPVDWSSFDDGLCFVTSLLYFLGVFFVLGTMFMVVSR